MQAFLPFFPSKSRVNMQRTEGGRRGGSLKYQNEMTLSAERVCSAERVLKWRGKRAVVAGLILLSEWQGDSQQLIVYVCWTERNREKQVKWGSKVSISLRVRENLMREIINEMAWRKLPHLIIPCVYVSQKRRNDLPSSSVVYPLALPSSCTAGIRVLLHMICVRYSWSLYGFCV